jgi:hypothetical protein
MMPKELGSERAAFSPWLFRPTRFCSPTARADVRTFLTACPAGEPRLDVGQPNIVFPEGTADRPPNGCIGNPSNRR